MFVSNFGSHSVSIIETTPNEVTSTFLIGTNPARAVVSADNSLLYVSNFGSDTVATYSIDTGRSAGMINVGHGPDALALSPNQNFLLVVDAKSGDVAVVRTAKLPQGSSLSAERALFTLIPVGLQPNQIAVKAFVSNPGK